VASILLLFSVLDLPLWLVLHLDPLASLWALTFAVLFRSWRVGSLEVRNTGVTPTVVGDAEMRWEEIRGIETRRWHLPPVRVEGLSIETTRLTGKPRRLFLPLSPYDPDWRQTPLAALLEERVIRRQSRTSAGSDR
jgi:hypothetical protein